jgi:hypothetical protein
MLRQSRRYTTNETTPPLPVEDGYGDEVSVSEGIHNRTRWSRRRRRGQEAGELGYASQRPPFSEHGRRRCASALSLPRHAAIPTDGVGTVDLGEDGVVWRDGQLLADE